MNSADPDRIKEIFAEAMQVPPNRRAMFLDEACAGQPDLCLTVKGLLRALDDAGRDGFLNTPTSGADGRLAPPWPCLSGEIGPYRLLERLGEGGFGEVWTAEQTEPMHRTVAVKILKLGVDSKEVLARFEIERQALALMDHPNVARIYDAGATEQGRPYFVMEHAAGLPITDYCDASRLPVRERLELFTRVCEAVQHAHTKGIIHRDLKPSNILLTHTDGKPVPKVIDFGIAKATATPLTQCTLHTEIGRLMGTPEYMSPEQAGTGGLDVDTRSDVYSLGVILYQLLTGTLPFEPDALRQADHSSLVKIIREIEPPAPSTRLSTLGAEPVNQHNGATPQEIAGRRDTEFATLQRQVKGELDWIVMKCLEKDRARRYETADGLASDVRHFLSGEPVVAAPPSRLYRFRKFVRRNRTMVTAATMVVAALLVGTTGTTFGLLRAERRQAEAEAARQQTQQVSDFQASMLRRINVDAMGRGIKERFREQVRIALGRQYVGEYPDGRKRTQEEIDAALAVFDGVTDAAQAADVARGVIDEFVLERATKTLEVNFVDQPLLRAKLHFAIGVTYEDLTLYDRAEQHLRASLEIRRRELGDDDPDTLSTFNELGEVLVDFKPDEAEPYYRKALEGRLRVLGEDHPDTLKSIHNWGYLLQAQGKYDESEQYYRKAWAESRRVLGKDDMNVIHNLGRLLLQQGKPNEAEPLVREALKTGARATIYLMGQVLQAQERLDEAEGNLRDAEEWTRRALGNEHRNTLASINGLGVLLLKQGKLQEAKACFREVIETGRLTLGEEYPITLQATRDLGFVLQATGQPEEAERLYLQALEPLRRNLGLQHPHTLRTIDNLACLLRDEGRLVEAQSLFAEGLLAARTGLGGHPMTAMLEHDYADLLCQLGQLDEAIELAQSAVDWYREHPDWEPSEAAHARRALVAALRAAGRDIEALEVLREGMEVTRKAVEAMRQQPGVTPGELASFLVAYAREAIAIGDSASLESAEGALRECLQIREAALPDDDPVAWLRFDAMSMLGEVLVGQANADSLTAKDQIHKLIEAEPLLLQAWTHLRDDPNVPPPSVTGGINRRLEALHRIVELYETWHAAEPDAGHDVQAAQWRAQLADPPEP